MKSPVSEVIKKVAPRTLIIQDNGDLKESMVISLTHNDDEILPFGS